MYAIRSYYAHQAFQIASAKLRTDFEAGMDYILSPIVIVLIIITVLSIVVGIRQSKIINSEGDVRSGTKRVV